MKVQIFGFSQISLFLFIESSKPPYIPHLLICTAHHLSSSSGSKES